MANKVFNVVKDAVKKVNIKRVNENTKRRNKRFQKLDRMQQRVAIAKDALAMLDAKKLIARRGVYASPTNWEDINLLPDNASCAAELAAAEQCKVCALGSIFMGAVHRGAVAEDCNISKFSLFDSDDDAMRDMLEPYFTESELWSMENYFESYSYSKSDDQSLRDVLNTIIESDGRAVRPTYDSRDEDY